LPPTTNYFLLTQTNRKYYKEFTANCVRGVEMIKEYRPVNVDLEVHAELVKRKEATHVSITKQLRVLVLGDKTVAVPMTKEEEIEVPPKAAPVEEKKTEAV